MTSHRLMFIATILILSSATLLIGDPTLAAQQDASGAGTSVQKVVTVLQRHGHGDEMPDVRQQDVQVRQERDLRRVTAWVPAQGAKAGLELLLLLDDSSRFVLAGQLDVLRKFISAQPATTLVAIGYAHNGTVELTHDFTADHDAAAKSLRMPLGSTVGAASPYLSITDELKRWPANPAHPRREILLMSDGIDPNGGGALNIYVDEAIDNVERAGVTVYSIYTPGPERGGQRVSLTNWGKTYLSMISQQSGGDSFYLGYGSAVSFGPYLDNLSRILNHQYLLTFLAQPEKKDSLQKVKITTEIPNAQLVAPNRVYVPADPK